LPPAPEELAGDAELSALLNDLFQQQRALLREEIRDGYQQLALQHTEPEPAPAAQPRTFGVSPSLAVVLILLAALVLWFAFLYWETEQRWQQANARNARLLETLEQQQTSRELRVPAEPSERPVDLVVDALQWGANEAARYGFSDIPLGDARARLLGELLERLEVAGFAGVVRVDSHVGRYCLVQAADGALRRAPPDAPVAECAQLGVSPGEATAMGERQTLSFANTVAAANANSNNGLTVIVTSHGTDQPAREYPPLAGGLSAGEWNQVADLNNRVEITLLAE
jgi:hypothetical protein